MTTMVGEYIIFKPPCDGWWRKRFKPEKDGAAHFRKRRTYSKLEQLTWCHMSNKTNPCDPIPLYRFVMVCRYPHTGLDWKNPLLNWIGFHGGMNFFFEYVYKESFFLTTNFHRTQTNHGWRISSLYRTLQLWQSISETWSGRCSPKSRRTTANITSLLVNDVYIYVFLLKYLDFYWTLIIVIIVIRANNPQVQRTTLLWQIHPHETYLGFVICLSIA